jgi:hypothetical protein
VISAAFGTEKEQVDRWLKQELLWDCLVASERKFLSKKGKQEDVLLQYQVESLWALNWGLGYVERLDFSEVCADGLVDLMPDIYSLAGSGEYVRNTRLRSVEEVEEACDLSYCLHWGVRDAAIRGRVLPTPVPSYVTVYRRKALEWMLSDESWDEIRLDT